MEKNKLIEDFLRYIILNKSKFIGAVIGLVIGILFLTIGFFKTILLFLCVLIGYIIGGRLEVEGSIKEFLDKILPQILK
ncbi:MAG: DUF2273 domain-containing protein [Halanaerobiales bacterium]